MGKNRKNSGNKLEKLVFFYIIEGFFLGTLWIFGLDRSTSQPWVKASNLVGSHKETFSYTKMISRA
jgi:hypothetical protein